MADQQQTNQNKLQKRNRELSIINEIARALNAEVNLPEALHTTLSLVAELLGLESGWIWLLDQHTGEHYLAAEQHLPSALKKKPAKMQGDCYCLRTFREGDMAGAANINVVTCSRLKGLVDGTDGLLYHSSIPLYALGKKLGVMNVASRDWRELTEDDLRLLYTIGDLLSIAVERSRLSAGNLELAVLEERNRLAREIHDTLSQGLSAIALQLETLDLLLDNQTDHHKMRQHLQQALSTTRSSLAEARRSVMDLRASQLEGKNLAEALDLLAAEFAAQAGFEYTMDIEGNITGLSNQVEMGLYRITREVLENVRRHAAASQVQLRLRRRTRQLSLSISDNGAGFDPQKIDSERFGLVGITERARLLGGDCRIISAPEQGTRIEVTIPFLKE